MEIRTREYQGLTIHYRPGTSDERVIEEVLVKAGYRKPSIGFDVLPGEVWLDLGANIGAFALYCKLKGATAVCYEPQRECFDLLCENVPEFECYQKAVSCLASKRLPFFRSRDSLDFSRGSTTYGKGSPWGSVLNENMHTSPLRYRPFDGVKMDIEGGEFNLIDNWGIPPCKKMVIEYHTSRCSDSRKMAKRFQQLRRRFRLVKTRDQLEEWIEKGEKVETYYDRPIYCLDVKKSSWRQTRRSE